VKGWKEAADLTLASRFEIYKALVNHDIRMVERHAFGIQHSVSDFLQDAARERLLQSNRTTNPSVVQQSR
jgi:hypothetical protein